MAELFVETKDFNHIYNQGRCFEQNHRYEDAVSRFREYLRKAPTLSVDERRDAEAHVDECERLAGMRPAQASPPLAEVVVQPAPAPAAVEAVATAPATEPSLVASVSNTTAARDGGRALRIAGIATGAVGLVSVATGVYFYTRATSLSDRVSKSETPSAADHKAGKNAETMQWIFYGIGGAAIAGGAVLYYLGWRASSDDEARTALVPLVAPGLAGISARGAF